MGIRIHFQKCGKNGNCFILNGCIAELVMCQECFEVVPESVGMFSGLTDRKKARLFEGEL
jgi:hypothetical protein